MKKLLYIAMSLLLVLALASCVSEPPQPPENDLPEPAPEATVKGRIVQADESTLLVAMDGGDICSIPLSDAQIVSDGRITDAGSLKAGMEIEAEYDGTVLELWPSQLCNVTRIAVTDEGSDLTGLYMEVLRELWERDDGLNNGAEILAFDLTEAVNLSQSEKTALRYLAWNEFGIETREGTFDQLREEGLIDADLLHFETGMLIKFAAFDVTDSGFGFKAEKWRGGDGAYYFEDCAATLKDGRWSYTIGAEAIA